MAYNILNSLDLATMGVYELVCGRKPRLPVDSDTAKNVKILSKLIMGIESLGGLD